MPLFEAFVTRLGGVLHPHVGGQMIRTTGEHPFYAEGKGWAPAGRLNVGNRLHYNKAFEGNQDGRVLIDLPAQRTAIERA